MPRRLKSATSKGSSSVDLAVIKGDAATSASAPWIAWASSGSEERHSFNACARMNYKGGSRPV
jgi:hypothetical protein